MSKSLLAIPKGRLYEGISNLFEEIRLFYLYLERFYIC